MKRSKKKCVNPDLGGLYHFFGPMGGSQSHKEMSFVGHENFQLMGRFSPDDIKVCGPFVPLVPMW